MCDACTPYLLQQLAHGGKHRALALELLLHLLPLQVSCIQCASWGLGFGVLGLGIEVQGVNLLCFAGVGRVGLQAGVHEAAQHEQEGWG